MNVSAVIPIRYGDCFNEDGAPRMRLAGHELWEITLRQACEATSLDQVVVAYDDERFLGHLKPWDDQIITCLRPKTLSGDNSTTLDVLAFVAGWLSEQGIGADYLMLLEITHPLRPKGIIDDLVGSTGAQNADSLITSYPIHYNFWRRDEAGRMDRISGTGENAEIGLYEELTGICSMFRPRCLASDNPFGEQVDLVPIDRFWATIDVRDEDGCWLAEQYLKRLKITL